MYDPSADISKTDWQTYSTAYGTASNVPDLLHNLAGADAKIAKTASHELWCGLCHQHAYVSSAALPSYPILMNVLRSTDAELAIEILDILLGFAHCTAPFDIADLPKRPDWMIQLRKLMIADRWVFEQFASSENVDVREFAEMILLELERPG